MNEARGNLTVMIVAGFLGAGKTTLIRELLPKVVGRGRPVFVILNDHLDAELDARTLRGMGAGVMAVSAGCVCCDDPEGLVEALLQIPSVEPCLVLLEANGSSDPYRLIELLLLTRALRARVARVMQTTVIHEARFGRRQTTHDRRTEEAQLRTGGLLVFNRGSRATDTQRLRVRDFWKTNNPAARSVGVEEVAVILIDEARSAAVPEVGVHEGGEHRHAHLAVRMSPPDPWSREDLRAWLRSLPADVLRVKGVARVDAETIAYFQRTDDPFENPSIHEALVPVGFEPVVLCIGHGLRESSLRAGFPGGLGTNRNREFSLR